MCPVRITKINVLYFVDFLYLFVLRFPPELCCTWTTGSGNV